MYPLKRIYAGVFDIGASKINAAVVEIRGRDSDIIWQFRFATPDNPERAVVVMKSLLSLTQMELGFLHYDVIQIASAAIEGTPDNASYVKEPANLNPAWGNFRIVEEFRRQHPVTFGTADSNAWAAGAFEMGKYRTRENRLPYLFIADGTGIGAGLLVPGDGDWMLYENGKPLELGHVQIDGKTSGRNDVVCNFCKMPCLETYVSGSGIKKRHGIEAGIATESIKEEVADNLALGVYRIIREVAKLPGSSAPVSLGFGGSVLSGWGINFVDGVAQRLEEICAKNGQAFPKQDMVYQDMEEIALFGAAAIGLKNIEKQKID